MAPLNQILYGPPGTGKTYATTALAVSIAEPAWFKTTCERLDGIKLRQTVKEKYDQLVAEQRVMFTTFHQSFSYEDFIEGIRATTDEQSGGLRYEIVDGIFKQLCDNADVKVQAATSDSITLHGKRIWKMSLGNTQGDEDYIFDECINQGYVLLGYGNDIDFSDCHSREAVKHRLEEKQQESIENNNYTLTSVHAFKNLITKGDLIIVSDGNHKFRAIAEITGDYEFLKTDERVGYQQLRRVKWLRQYQPSLPKERLFLKSLSQMTLYELKPTTVDHTKLEQLLAPTREQESEHKPHVLIIDEINRGNISRIFGELITLLEPSKRKGAEDAQTAVLPYSKTPFSVPDNVYLIGTMNTADKSLAQLDLALRRRFSFNEMLPQPELLAGVTVFGVDLAQMLTRINQRIEVLLDAEHLIGHSYFMPLVYIKDESERQQALAALFKDKLVPLLQEYFFDDHQRIGWVLNDPAKHPDHRFIITDEALRDRLPSLQQLFAADIAEQLMDRRHRLNKAAFTNAEAYRGIVA
ncbi:AAA family ATPase [Zobellella maritima]|uniref:AAA family ATPase n=1 Tax=Zobellella maritima TaxID=2059725 RepID=UPI0018E51460|nr:AAA family ATPase [Zobellella maritima]